MKKIIVRLGDRSYPIIIGRRLIARSGTMVKDRSIGTDAAVITNKYLFSLLSKQLTRSFRKSGIAVRFFIVPDSEKAKSEPVATRLIKEISAYSRGRSVFIVALGGGVVGDVAGFVASVYKRGIPYVQIPTTLLAQVDSAIGGKVAIDLSAAKNLVGSFYQPKMVIADISILRRLPKRQITNGMAEIIKYGVIKDRLLFGFVEKHIGRIVRGDERDREFVVARSAAIKSRIVESDEYDTKDIRAVLNYGHTVGHAIEAASGYTGAYQHGEAVALGMVIANDIATRIGTLSERTKDRIEALIRNAGLPIRLKAGISVKRILGAYRYDKKFRGPVSRMVLPAKIGLVKIVEKIPDDVLRRVITERIAC